MGYHRNESNEHRSDEAYRFFQKGLGLLASSDAHAAAVVLENARALEPTKGSISEALARAYLKTGRLSTARAEFARAIELDPVNDYALFCLGLCELRSGDRAGARRHFRLATAMRPENDDYRAALTRVSA